MNPLVFFDHLHESVTQHRDRPCLHIKRNGAYQSWTYGEFHADFNRCVSILKRMGFRRGIQGVVIGENSPEWVIAHLSIALAGGCTVPIDPNIPPAEIEEIVRLIEPRVVFCSRTYLKLFNDLKIRFSSIQKIVSFDADTNAATFGEFISDGDARDNAFSRQFAPDDPVAIIFTSGTTGKAKGVVLVQKNFTAVPLCGVPRMRVTSADVMMAVLPLHHVFGFAACVAAALTAGVAVVFVPVLKGPLIVEGLKDKGVTILPAVPQMLELFFDNIERTVRAKGLVVRMVFSILHLVSTLLGPVLGIRFRRKLFGTVHQGFGGKLNLIISGGSSLKKRYFYGFRRLGFTIVEGYGLTETFGPITLCPYENAKQASVGTVLDGNEMTIDKPDASGVGEVLFKGNTVFPGYYNNETETKKVFDENGWFHTGDLGRVTSDGSLYLCGRSKDLIVLDSGKNVYPDEIEEYFLASPLIEDMGVFGVHQNQSEVVCAVILPSKEIRKRSTVTDAEEIVRQEIVTLGRQLPSYKKINHFIVVFQPLPRTTTRKLKKPELRAMFEAARKTPGHAVPEVRLTVSEIELVATAEYRQAQELVEQLSPEAQNQAIGPRSNLELDLGLDSLKRLDLFSRIEQVLRCSVPESAALRIETLGDLAVFLRETKNAPHAPQVPGAEIQPQPPLVVRENSSLLFHALPSCCKAFSRTFWGLTPKGMEHLDQKGPFLFCANHESYLDIFWILSLLPWAIRRRTFTLGKIELLSSPLLSPFLNRSNLIAVEREGEISGVLQTAASIINQGYNLVIFPEGTRTRTGRLGKFRSGIGKIMLETGVSVVPVRVRGGFEIWPSGGKLKVFGNGSAHASVSFGAPVSVGSLQAHHTIPANSDPDVVAECIRDIISGM